MNETKGVLPNPDTLCNQNADGLTIRLQRFTNGQITALSLQISLRIADADDVGKRRWEIIHRCIAGERKRRNPAG